MRRTQERIREGGLRGGKTAGLALLALLSGLGGCQWTGDGLSRRPVLDPIAAVAQEDKSNAEAGAGFSRLNGEGAAAISPGASAEAWNVTARASGAATSESSSRAMADELPVTWQDQKQRGTRAEKDQVYQVDRTLPSLAVGMGTPALPTPEKVLPITLWDSLAIAGVENPVINIAEQTVKASLALQWQARALLLPNVNVGVNYDMHNGPLQPSFGAIRKVDRQAVNYGLGVYTVAAETIKIPGLWINTPLANALYEPLVARQVVANRRFRATATRNDILLDVARAYLALLGAEGRLAVIRQSEEDFKEVVRLTRNFANTGQGREGDARRALGEALALEFQEKRAQEEVAVASADLAQLLNLDPSTRLQTGEVPIQVVQLVDPNTPLPQLLDIATRNRPEILAAAANIRASQLRVRQEKTRPLLPLLIMGFSADDFGGGAVASSSGNVFNPHTGFVSGAPSPETGGQTVPKFGRITGRTDFDVLALWTLQNMGFGNIAHVRQRQAEVGLAEAEQTRVINEVAREVSEAYNLSAERFRSIQIERRRIDEASNGFQRDLGRIIGGEGRPIEVLNQAKRLASARQALLEAVLGFDRAQFQLFVALGQPPTLALNERPPCPP